MAPPREAPPAADVRGPESGRRRPDAHRAAAHATPRVKSGIAATKPASITPASGGCRHAREEMVLETRQAQPALRARETEEGSRGVEDSISVPSGHA